MFQITNLNTLGTEYTILDNNAAITKTIRIISQEDILEAALGRYQVSEYKDYHEYMNLSLMYLEGFVEDPLAVSWYATKEEDFDLHDAVTTAIRDGNSIVIMEILDPEVTARQLKIN